MPTPTTAGKGGQRHVVAVYAPGDFRQAVGSAAVG
jgi:hypothetical protein